MSVEGGFSFGGRWWKRGEDVVAVTSYIDGLDKLQDEGYEIVNVEVAQTITQYLVFAKPKKQESPTPGSER